jgi:PAS domain S-box-containing protein
MARRPYPHGDASPYEYELLVEAAEECAIFLLDPDGRFATWNAGAERMYGYRADEILGQPLSRLFDGGDQLAGKPDQELRIAAELGRHDVEGWRVRKNGARFRAKVRITALRDPSGELRGFGKLTRDLTERQRAEKTARELALAQAARSAAERDEASLRESEERYRQLSRRLEVILEGVGDALMVLDQSGRIIFANAAAVRSVGCESTEALLSTPPEELYERFDLFDEAGRPFDLAKLPALLALEGIDSEPVLLRVREKATASEWWALARASAVRDADGRPDLAVNIWQDVTNQHREDVSVRCLARATQALSQSFDYEAALRDFAATLVPEIADWCAIDLVEEGEVKLAALANVDPQKSEMARAVRLRYPPSVSRVGEVIRTGRSLFASEIKKDLLQGWPADPGRLAAYRTLELRSLISVPLKTRERTIGAMTLATTQSGRRYDERDLALAEELGRRAGIAIENARLYRDAQRAIQLRDEFLLIAGHELRTPLTALDLQLQSLLATAAKSGSLPQPLRLEERLRKTIAQSRRLGRLVHELLDVSRITSGRVVLEPETVDLARVVEEIVERHASELARSGSPISFECAGDTTGRWDRSRVDQVVSNILNNAIKYGDGKAIDVRLARRGDRVVLSVRDQGIGIPAERQAKLFQRFERAVSERNYGGLGLGLWIVREIVQAHGGTVGFESEHGKGSIFVVELPVSPP